MATRKTIAETAITTIEVPAPLPTEEELQKERYLEYCEKHKVDLERITDSAAGSFWALSDDNLKALASTYDKNPFNYVPATADALLFELHKRGFIEEEETLRKLLPTIDWYNKPWIRY